MNHWHVAEQINSDMPTFNKKNAYFFLFYSAEQLYVNYKMAIEYTVENDAADASSKEDLSIDTILDPC
jgi:hypothetical protein